MIVEIKIPEGFELVGTIGIDEIWCNTAAHVRVFDGNPNDYNYKYECRCNCNRK